MNKQGLFVGSLVTFMLAVPTLSIAAIDEPSSAYRESPPPNGDPDGRFWAPRTGSVRWQGRTYNLSILVLHSEAQPDVIGWVPIATVRLTVTAADGQPMPANFPRPRLTLEHRNRFLRPALTLTPAIDFQASNSNEYTGFVAVPWTAETRMTARITFANGRRSVMTKIKNVLAIIPNPLAG